MQRAQNWKMSCVPKGTLSESCHRWYWQKEAIYLNNRRISSRNITWNLSIRGRPQRVSDWAPKNDAAETEGPHNYGRIGHPSPRYDSSVVCIWKKRIKKHYAPRTFVRNNMLPICTISISRGARITLLVYRYRTERKCNKIKTVIPSTRVRVLVKPWLVWSPNKYSNSTS